MAIHQLLRRRERFLRPAMVQQELWPRLSVVVREIRVGRQGKCLSVRPFGRLQLPQCFVTHGEELEIVCVVPVKLCRDVLRAIIVILQIFGFEEFLYRFLGPPRSPEIMPVHVVCVRNRRSQPHVDLALFQGFFQRPVVFERVRKVMVRGKIVRRKFQRRFIERDRVYAAALPMGGGGSLIGKAAQDPQPRVVRGGRQCVSEGLAIREVLLQVAAVLEIFQLPRANRHSRALPFARLSRQRLCFL